MNGLISIIVPVYNTDKYLKKCLNSIINQTYKNLEIILIDDGSTDDSGNICDNYAKKDNRIIVKHTKNNGVSTARNIALDIAKGDYITFVDSDDYIDKNMYELMINKMVASQSDICICAFCKEDNNGNPIKPIKNDPKEGHYIFDRIDFPNEIHFNSNIMGYTWNKVYNNRLIKKNKIRFNRDFKMTEDSLFNMEIFDSNKKFKCCYINSNFYHYVIYQHDNITNYNMSNMSFFKVIKLEIDILKQNNLDYHFLMESFVTNFTKVKFYINKYKIIKNDDYYIIEEKFKNYKNNISIKKSKNKIKIIIVLYLPIIYYLILYLKKEKLDYLLK